MRRMLALLIAGLIAASLATPSLAGDNARTVSRSYTVLRGTIHFHFSDEGSDWWFGTQREIFRARGDESRLSLSLADDTGNPVRGRVEINGKVVEFCSDTQKPIGVTPGQKVAVSAIFGECEGTLSTVTEGTIAATFSK